MANVRRFTALEEQYLVILHGVDEGDDFIGHAIAGRLLCSTWAAYAMVLAVAMGNVR